MAKFPVNLSKVKDAWGEVGALTDRSASILLAGDSRLVALAQERLVGEGPVRPAWSGDTGDLQGITTYAGELLVVLVAPEDEADASAALGEGRLGGPAVLAVDEGSVATGSIIHTGQASARVSFSDSDAGWQALFAACAQMAGHDMVALARRYPALRRPAAQRVVNQTAAQNGVIGLLVFIPGADMPTMTLNQVKMLLQLAGIYGERVDMDRALELAAVVGLGLGFRGLARRLVALVPGFGWLFKALVAYISTSSLGAASVRYFESGAPASTGRVVAALSSLRR